MDKKIFWVLLFIVSLFVYSCANDDIENLSGETKQNEYFVSQQKAKEIGGNFFKNQAKSFECKIYKNLKL